MTDAGKTCKIENFDGDSQITLPTFIEFMHSYMKEASYPEEFGLDDSPLKN